jgi:hypothetical protein
MNNPPRFFLNRDEMEALVRKFEDAALQPDEFHHRQHVAVVIWYLSRFTPLETARRMREGLYRFLDHHQIDRRKYHETITLFWIKKVCALLRQFEQESPVAEIANEMIETCGDPQLIFDYYSRELIASKAAREAWVEPDLKPLDFQDA